MCGAAHASEFCRKGQGPHSHNLARSSCIASPSGATTMRVRRWRNVSARVRWSQSNCPSISDARSNASSSARAGSRNGAMGSACWLEKNGPVNRCGFQSGGYRGCADTHAKRSERSCRPPNWERLWISPIDGSPDRVPTKCRLSYLRENRRSLSGASSVVHSDGAVIGRLVPGRLVPGR